MPANNILCIYVANSAPRGEYDPGNFGWVDDHGVNPPAIDPNCILASFDTIISTGFNIMSLGQLTRNGF